MRFCLIVTPWNILAALSSMERRPLALRAVGRCRIMKIPRTGMIADEALG